MFQKLLCTLTHTHIYTHIHTKIDTSFHNREFMGLQIHYTQEQNKLRDQEVKQIKQSRNISERQPSSLVKKFKAKQMFIYKAAC